MANQIRVEAVTASAEFRIEVDGEVWPEPGTPAAEFGQEGVHYGPNWIEFSSSQSAALGRETYTWNYEGPITKWEIISGDTNEYVNGNQVTADQVVRHYEMMAQNVPNRVWVQAGANSTAEFVIETDGSVHAGSHFGGNMDSTAATDTVSNGGWSDVYYTGNVTHWSLDGNAAAYTNCDQGPPKVVEPTPEPPDAQFSYTVDGFDIHVDGSDSLIPGDEDTLKWYIRSSGGSWQLALSDVWAGTIPVQQGGTYDIQFEIVDTHGQSSVDQRTVTVAEQGEPAYDVQSFVPSPVPHGSVGKVTVSVDNVGDAEGTVDVQFVIGHLSGTETGTLAPGESFSPNFEFDSEELGVGDHEWSVFTNGTQRDGGVVTIEESDGDQPPREPSPWPLVALGLIGGAVMFGKDRLGEIYDDVMDDLTIEPESEDDENEE